MKTQFAVSLIKEDDKGRLLERTFLDEPTTLQLVRFFNKNNIAEINQEIKSILSKSNIQVSGNCYLEQWEV